MYCVNRTQLYRVRPIRRRQRSALGPLLVTLLLGSAGMAQAQSRPVTGFDARFFFKLAPRPADAETVGPKRHQAKPRIEQSRGIGDKMQTSPATEPPPSWLLEKPAGGGATADDPLLRHRVAGKPIAIGRAGYYERPGRTANGERYDPDGLTASHKTFAFGTRLRVVNLRNNKSVIVRVNDRSPAKVKFTIDLSRGSASAIGITKRAGTGAVALYKVD